MIPKTALDTMGIRVAVDRGRITDVVISPRRAIALGQLVLGRAAGEVVTLLSRLFALCPAAQGAAVATAIDAARGRQAERAVANRRSACVLIERLFELVRSAFAPFDASIADGLARPLRRIAAVRDAFGEGGNAEARDLPAAADELDEALTQLGLSKGCFADDTALVDWLASDMPIARLMRIIACSPSATFGALPVEPLDATADRQIGERLLADGLAFSAHPELDGRVPETGSLARHLEHPLLASQDTAGKAGIFLRLLARLVDAQAIPALLRKEQDPAERATISSYALGEHVGLAAVECARGRLCHLVVLDREECVKRLEILSPTEWNFHAAGPLVRALRGAAIAEDELADKSIERLVAAFDPCVAYRVSIVEGGHA